MHMLAKKIKISKKKSKHMLVESVAKEEVTTQSKQRL